MTNEVYHQQPGLSFSGMKDLAVSPLRYWYLHINPDRPAKRETPEMRFGSALHCMVLEPHEFLNRYCTDPEIPAGALDTMDDLREFIRSKGAVPKGKAKADLIVQVQDLDANVPIVQVIEAEHEALTSGRTYLPLDDWNRVHSADDALRSEPRLQPILAEGEAEVPLFATDPSTGVPLRCKLDWRTPSLTLDIKTFSQQRGKSIDECVNNAIWYERYHWQAFHYTALRTLKGDKRPRYLLAFVESDPPHDVRLRELRPTIGEVCMYWERARVDVRGLIDLYAECMAKYGDRPWRSDSEIELLSDEQLPQLAWGI